MRLGILDGDYVIYTIQHKIFKEDSHGWAFTSFEYFGTPEIETKKIVKTEGTVNPWSKSGQCWQETGIEGVYDLEDGLLGLEWMKKGWPTGIFQLLRISIHIETKTMEVL